MKRLRPANRSAAPGGQQRIFCPRYGQLLDLSATTEELLLKHDRSFIFNVDKLDEDETQGQLEAGTVLARELREVVVPEVDTNVYKIMAEGAGVKPEAAALTKSNIYAAVLAASQAWTMRKCRRQTAYLLLPRQHMRF